MKEVFASVEEDNTPSTHRQKKIDLTDYIIVGN
jgi:hypothetical protein